MFTTSRTERFQREAKKDDTQQKPDVEDQDDNHEDEDEVMRFSAEEEASLLAEADAQKATANKLFGQSAFKEAIETYEGALSTCPNYLDYQVAVLHSNIAACHIKLAEWKEAVTSATKALDGLDKLRGRERKTEDGQAKEEIVSEGATKAEDTSAKGKKESDVEKLCVKVLLRRAKARFEQGGWSSLQGAEEDYKVLSTMNMLSPADKKLVQKQLSILPARIKVAQEKETAEMMGKLKELGNGLLKPFGLSTDNFQMNKDEKTGGYSMNFKQ